MIIVAGQILVEPEQREAYLESCVEVVEQARSAPGCLDFALTADVLTEGRINVFERWESAEAVQHFRGDGPSEAQQAEMISASVSEYEVSAVRDLT
ncbi:MAG TPA: antibiotic biosynthesis monooxygenase family protein [Solirubrobacteraceae bacterium]|jgi:quinol monooxygenase YgiN